MNDWGMMNIELAKKNKPQFDWWMEDYHKRSVMVKECGGKWKEDNDPFCIWRKSYRSADNYKLVINDEYAKFRMAEADGETIQYHYSERTGGPCWKDVADGFEFSGGAVSWRIKHSWKWQDEISESKPVLCKHPEGYIIEAFRIGNYTCNSKPTIDYICKVNNSIYSTATAEPITAADLHPFQRVGYYSIEELEKLFCSYLNRSDFDNPSFIEWLKEKEAK